MRRWCLARGFFYPEDGGDTFLRNFGSYKIYKALHPRRRHFSDKITVLYILVVAFLDERLDDRKFSTEF
jgi:hypothetical protein